MLRILVMLAALGAGLAWAVRKFANRPATAPTAHRQRTIPDRDELWRNAERETIAFRMRSGPGPFM
jgi:hypothetical protein